ncbi:tRNA (adenine(22)-N(1))-methyltransferase [Facklamia miroungae]|uniref:tRNA (Adenine22-N1)-methyltransferase n=1 Tax=Facklamia miroungae TaxID=120956 RepID=A0A1G7PJ99_9LACT|nr:tRNA (adenine(22)-N(1))-methyltransferase TrmK [Facklamia miroungae]NKZ28734.1 tRNA (adenine(22)-N(1))-methyltransferase TrmK [Facklamia miroungae]SDF86376.1 tRNA (adenine22-N1)-methyltransferase [Facklamia miroungae]
MNTERLSKRLDQVAQYIVKYGQKPIRLADIGSDHAYLPCNLLKNHQIEYAVAGEVVAGPYHSALKQVRANQLDEQVTVRLADGFEAVEASDAINFAAVCGMGGGLIVSILEAGYQANKLPDRIVLQPNTAVAKVRAWLHEHNYHILNEKFIEERGQFYEVLMAQLKSEKANYTSQEIMFGPVHIVKRGPVFEDYWQNELHHHYFILSQLEDGLDPAEMAEDRKTKIECIQAEIDKIEEVIPYDRPFL